MNWSDDAYRVGPELRGRADDLRKVRGGGWEDRDGEAAIEPFEGRRQLLHLRRGCELALRAPPTNEMTYYSGVESKNS